MQQEEDNRRSEFASCNITPERLQITPRNVASVRRNILSQEIKRRVSHTPRDSPDNYPKTPQSSGSFKKDTEKLLLDSNKRKIQSSHNESLEKIQKTCPSGKFVNTLIEQWSKYMEIRTPLPQTGRVEESPITHETKHKRAVEDQMVQRLQKKLQAAKEALSSLSASHEAELRAKEEILQQLNNDWESITKYYYEISESLKGFQKHKDNLSKLYNDVIVAQQSTLKKLQQELSNTKLKDEEQRNIISITENKVVNQEKRIQEMMIAEAELKKHLEDIKNESVLEKNRLQNVHAEEKIELVKKQENLTSINRELQVQLKEITEEKQKLTNRLAEKDEEISKLQEEIHICKNKIEGVLCQNAELSAIYEKSAGKEEELSKELHLRAQEMERLRENLIARQEIESSLAKDLGIIDDKYKKMQNDLANVENKFMEARSRNMNLEKSLQEAEINNERKIVELNRKIELLEKEKERVLLDKRSKIKELDNSCEMLKEKYEAEITSLKREFDVKFVEMKKTIDTQNSASIKLTEALNKMYDENQNKKENYSHRANERHTRLQENSKDILQQVMESNVIDITKETECQTQRNQVREINEEQFQSQGNVDKSKIRCKEKGEVLNPDQDIYNFITKEINDELQNVKNHATPKKKIFKSRNSGLRQYGTPKKLQYETPGKTTKK